MTPSLFLLTSGNNKQYQPMSPKKGHSSCGHNFVPPPSFTISYTCYVIELALGGREKRERETGPLKHGFRAPVQWPKPVIPTTWEVEIGRWWVESTLSKTKLARPYLKEQVRHGSGSCL
jgi:hypothetical protein